MPEDDPFSIESVVRDTEPIGRTVVYMPHATYPIHVRGLGGRSIESARELITDLARAVERAEQREGAFSPGCPNPACICHVRGPVCPHFEGVDGARFCPRCGWARREHLHTQQEPEVAR